VADQLSEARFAWDTIVHWGETEESFLVYTTPQAARIIPKRALPSEEQRTLLRQLLSERVREESAASEAGMERSSTIPTVAFFVGIELVMLARRRGRGAPLRLTSSPELL